MKRVEANFITARPTMDHLQNKGEAISKRTENILMLNLV
jgi:hypothetical protein